MPIKNQKSKIKNLPSPSISRRRLLAASAATAACTLSPGLRNLLAHPGHERPRPFRISACDWSIGRAGRVDALALASEIGLDGVQVSFGRPGGETDLRDPQTRRRYAKASREHGVEVSSLALGILNSVPYAESPEAERWVRQSVDVMEMMGRNVILLAFFANGDIKDKPEAQEEVIRRLTKVAPQAEDAGITLGLETWLDAEAHMRILDAVDSPAVKVYYDTANMHKMGYDIYQEIRRLGDRICEVHCKENGHLLGRGPIDFKKVRAALDDIGYRGWLVIEGATVEGKSVKECYIHNQKHLRSIFPTGG